VEIRRTELLERSIHALPRLVQIVAPPGYGKSVFARQLGELLPSFASCDCVGVRDVADLARRLIGTLAEARPLQAGDLARTELSLSGDPGDWVAVALAAWSAEGPPAGLLLQDAEELAQSQALLELYSRLVRGAPRVLIVCSREPLPIPYGHDLNPVDILAIGQRDLRFSTEEIAAMVGSGERAYIDAIERVTEGWPVVVALVAQRAKREPLSTLLLDLRDVVRDQLYEYLASQLVAALSPTELDLANALASIPDARLIDLERAVGRRLPRNLGPLRERLPVSISGDRYALHPMLAEILRKEHGERAEALLRASAAAAASAGEEVRAAQLYLALRDDRSAASVLRNVGPYLMSTPSLDLAAVLGALDDKTLLEFPALWCAAMVHRGYAIPPAERLAMARSLWENLPKNADSLLKRSVFSSYINAYTNIGLVTDARALVEQFSEGMDQDDYKDRATAMLWTAILDVNDGRYDRIPELTRALTPALSASDLTHWLYLYLVISPMHRSRGEWQCDEEALARARELGERMSLPINLVVLVESAFAAWARGNDSAFEHYVGSVEAAVSPGTIRGFRFFIACARGQARSVGYGYEHTKARAQGLLIASAGSGDIGEARSFAEEARQVADDSGRRFMRIFARAALAELDPSRREAWADEALEIAQGLQSEPMRTALEELRAGRDDVGILTPFVTRFRRFRAHPTPIKIHALEGRVLVDGVAVKLASTELSVLLALAEDRRWQDVAHLSEMLFEDLDLVAAANRLYVYVHRIRRRLGTEAIVGGAVGYRLGPGVWVDLWEADALLSEVMRRSARRLDDATRDRAAQLPSLPRAELSAFVTRARLPSTFERRLADTRQRLLFIRATDALERGDTTDALELANLMVRDDNCDEEAHLLLIRAHLRRGERQAAEHAWRHYRTTLRAELGTEPPPFATFAESAAAQTPSNVVAFKPPA
jgi:DNA-binding SARP family transcriptional activator